MLLTCVCSADIKASVAPAVDGSPSNGASWTCPCSSSIIIGACNWVGVGAWTTTCQGGINHSVVPMFWTMSLTLLYISSSASLGCVKRSMSWYSYFMWHCGVHIAPILRRLHWLPVQQRIEFKLAIVVYKVLNGLSTVLNGLLPCVVNGPLEMP